MPLHTEIVQHDEVRGVGQDFLELVEVVYFDFAGEVGEGLGGASISFCDASDTGDVVVFDQYSVAQTHAVIDSAPATNGVLG